MTTYGRRTILRGIGASAIAATALRSLPAFAQDRKAVRIGYAISKTGANAAGAGITTTPNYLLWVKDVNDAGGIKLSRL
ncbi:MAG: twin-arginine translocation pathway signal protein, partial [Devosia nanyangense]|nr:twin-arginine translocation pathway signal protein [Devosia nanyangense]